MLFSIIKFYNRKKSEKMSFEKKYKISEIFVFLFLSISYRDESIIKNIKFKWLQK